MDTRSRVQAVLEGRQPDRPPVSFWHHFRPDQASGPAALDAHLAHLEKYDLDFLKVMNDNPYPRGGVDVVQTAADLGRLKVWSGDEEGFGLQLELLAKLRERLGHAIMMTTTVFSPWTTLRKLAAVESFVHRPPDMNVGGDPRDAALSRLLRDDRDAVKQALRVIAESLGRFADRCLTAGADGIFLSVRDDWVDPGDPHAVQTYDELAAPADLHVLHSAARGSFNMLHACGKPRNFARFAAYPCHVLNWADRSAGPAIAAVRDYVKPAICGGVDNLVTLVKGTPADCAAEVHDALRQAGSRPIMISAGCTYDPEAVPESNLRAVCKAARNAA